MTVRELIKKLTEFDLDSQVTITDGYDGVSYNTNNISIVWYDDAVDIGIAGNKINE